MRLTSLEERSRLVKTFEIRLAVETFEGYAHTTAVTADGAEKEKEKNMMIESSYTWQHQNT